MRRSIAMLFAALAVALAGCGAGGTTPVDDYTGSPQTVTSRKIDPPKTRNDRVCAKYRTVSGKKKCAEYKTVKVTTDDLDFILVLADGTEVDVDKDEYDRYPEGSTYP